MKMDGKDDFNEPRIIYFRNVSSNSSSWKKWRIRSKAESLPDISNENNDHTI